MIRIELYGDDFRLHANDFKIYQKKLNSDIMLKLLSVDCKMKFFVDNNMFFNDWICPLEFYYQLRHWYNKILDGEFIDFHYNTMESSENPIISLVFDSNNQTWKLDGTFKLYDEKKLFVLKDLGDFYHEFYEQLLKH